MTEELSIEVIPSIEMMNALGATKDREEPVVMQLPREHSVIEVEEDILEIGDRPASTKKKSIILIMFAIVFATMAIAAGTGYGIYTNKNHTETETSAAALSFVEDECKEEELPPEREFSEILIPTSFPTAVSTRDMGHGPFLTLTCC